MTPELCGIPNPNWPQHQCDLPAGHGFRLRKLYIGGQWMDHLSQAENVGWIIPPNDDRDEAISASMTSAMLESSDFMDLLIQGLEANGFEVRRKPNATRPRAPMLVLEGSTTERKRKMELPEFLLARIAEIEAVAQAATPGPWYDDLLIKRKHDYIAGVFTGRERVAIANPGDATHLALHDPVRVLAECSARRLIVAAWKDLARIISATEDESKRNDLRMGRIGLETAMAALVLPFRDHPDFSEEWDLS